jgi:hypothetical protein
VIVYSNVKFKSNDDKMSPCFRPLRMASASGRCLPVLTWPWVSFKHVHVYTRFSENVVYLPPNCIICFPEFC